MQRSRADQWAQSRAHATTVGPVGGGCQTASEEPSHLQYHPYQYRHHGVLRQWRTSYIKSSPKRVGAIHWMIGWYVATEPETATRPAKDDIVVAVNMGAVSFRPCFATCNALWENNHGVLALRRLQRRSTDCFGKRQFLSWQKDERGHSTRQPMHSTFPTSTTPHTVVAIKTNLCVFQTPSDHGKTKSDTTSTPMTQEATWEWFGSHPTSHHVYHILIVGSPNHGRVGEKGDQNLGQRNPQTRGLMPPKPLFNATFQTYKKLETPLRLRNMARKKNSIKRRREIMQSQTGGGLWHGLNCACQQALKLR